MRCFPKRLSLLLATAVLSLGLPASARAYSPIRGPEGFSGGVLHPLTTPAHLLVTLALGLLIGQRIPLDLRTVFVVFVPSLAFALILTTTGLVSTVYQPFFIGIALCAAIPVALQKPIPLLGYRTLIGTAALALGFDSVAESSPTSVLIKTLLGTGIMVTLLVFDFSYYASLAMRRQWSAVGVRIFGSWIIAIALMMLALSFLSSRSEVAAAVGW